MSEIRHGITLAENATGSSRAVIRTLRHARIRTDEVPNANLRLRFTGIYLDVYQHRLLRENRPVSAPGSLWCIGTAAVAPGGAL
jgi:hypothetical protein